MPNLYSQVVEKLIIIHRFIIDRSRYRKWVKLWEWKCRSVGWFVSSRSWGEWLTNSSQKVLTCAHTKAPLVGCSHTCWGFQEKWSHLESPNSSPGMSAQCPPGSSCLDARDSEHTLCLPQQHGWSLIALKLLSYAHSTHKPTSLGPALKHFLSLTIS